MDFIVLCSICKHTLRSAQRTQGVCGGVFMDDRVKCMCYEYLIRRIGDEENLLRELNNRFLDRSFPSGSDDYIEYAISLARKTVLQEVFSSLCTIMSFDFPDNTK